VSGVFLIFTDYILIPFFFFFSFATGGLFPFRFFLKTFAFPFIVVLGRKSKFG